MVGTYHSRGFYDKEGNLIEVNHYVGIDSVYNPDNPSVVLSGNFSSVTTLNTVTGEFKWTGASYAIKIPGYGMLLKQSGVYQAPSGKFVGIHTTFDPEAKAAFCAMLAGD